MWPGEYLPPDTCPKCGRELFVDDTVKAGKDRHGNQLYRHKTCGAVF